MIERLRSIELYMDWAARAFDSIDDLCMHVEASLATFEHCVCLFPRWL